MTTSAVAKLIPNPPALVDNIKMNFSLFGALNSSICLCLSSCEVPPSNLQYFLKHKYD